jgi:hypothetical protein
LPMRVCRERSSGRRRPRLRGRCRVEVRIPFRNACAL